ncbi:MAG: hypothetical protein ACI4OJ_10960 [Lachnospiraceae bacterium]
MVQVCKARADTGNRQKAGSGIDCVELPSRGTGKRKTVYDSLDLMNPLGYDGVAIRIRDPAAAMQGWNRRSLGMQEGV